MPVTLSRTQAVELFSWIGWGGAHDWDVARFNKMVAMIPQAMEGDNRRPEDPVMAQQLIDIQADLEDKIKPIVVEDKDYDADQHAVAVQTTTTPLPPPPKPPKTPKATTKLTKQKKKGISASAAKKPAPLTDEELEQVERERREDARRYRQPVPEDLKKHGTGVRKGAKTRGYYAGMVIAIHGLEAGITDKMIQEVNRRYGRTNDGVSKQALSWAHSAIRGYIDAANATD